MPMTTTSGDDTVVGRTVPSTAADPSKGSGTTLPASSSTVDNVRNVIIVRPTRKFGTRKLVVIKAPM